MKLAELKPDSRNANKGTDRGRKLVKDSLRKYGAGRSILVDKHGNVIAGNKTLEGAKAVGLKDVQIVKSDGSKLVAVQRTDLDIKDKAARELAIADNRASEVGLEWDPSILKALEEEVDIDLRPFWNERELVQFWASTKDSAPEPRVDQAAALQRKWATKTGQLWQIGPHRLLCGDSTRKEDVARLWAKVVPRELPVLMITDPPYGVDYDPNWRNEVDRANGKPYGASAVGLVSNDDRKDWGLAWKLFPGEVAYVWHAGRFAGDVAMSLTSNGFEIRCQIIWAKPRFVISRGHYHWQHEPCWYAVKTGSTARWIGDRSQTTLWQISHIVSETGHGTQKPVECMQRPAINHDGDVYDPFVGSGTTICAAELSKRTCYAIEIEPKYVAVCLQRLAGMGLKPKLA